MRNWVAAMTVLTLLALAAVAGAKHPEDQYGRELPIVGQLGCGPAMDVALDGDRLYAIGGGCLYVADATDPAAPKIIGKLGGLGSVRQIVVRNGVAYITSREDGLFVVDVRHAERPELLCHYDTIELATGIAVSGDVAFVACRNCGVELIDVRDPRRPIHMSTVRTGEAQSVTARHGILFAGVWGTSEVVVCDVRDPWHPRILSKVPLDGYGDGVEVHGKYCFAATGHHSRATPRKNEGDPGFGRGHGMEIFDVEDPGQPRFVARIKLPVWYRIGMDMWDVIPSGRHAFVADTYNGVFVIDVADVSQPRLVAHCQLPIRPGKNDPTPVGGMAIGKGCIYVAGAWSDVHVIRAEGLAQPVVPEPDRAPVIPPRGDLPSNALYTVYEAGGQVYAVAPDGQQAWIAAGMAGVQLVAIEPQVKKLAQYRTEGFAMDVKIQGDRLYVAEAMGGLSIWKRGVAGELTCLGRYRVPGESIKQVVVPSPGKYALLHVGASRLQIVDVSDPSQVRCVLRDSRLGLFYSLPLVNGLTEGRYACCQWHVTGLYWYDLGGEKPRYTGDNFGGRVSADNGATPLGDKLLLVYGGKYLLTERSETRSPSELPQYAISGCRLNGKPTLDGQRLYTSSRYTGQVCAVDIGQIDKPRLLSRLELAEHPGVIAVEQGLPLIPGGYQGLVIWHAMRQKLD